MSVPDYNDAYTRARDTPPFSNSTEGEGWMSGWCHGCAHDRDGRDMTGPGCPLILVALLGRTPAEWLDGPRDENGHYSIRDQYHCMCFRSDEDGPDDTEPRPVPDPPGQGTLLPRDGLEKARMLTTYPTPVKADA